MKEKTEAKEENELKMKGTEAERAVIELIQQWAGQAAGVPEDAAVEVREEPHCPDPGCPLRRTVLEWMDADGGRRRAVIVKPLVYVRQAEVERALRRGVRVG